MTSDIQVLNAEKLVNYKPPEAVESASGEFYNLTVNLVVRKGQEFELLESSQEPATLVQSQESSLSESTVDLLSQYK